MRKSGYYRIKYYDYWVIAFYSNIMNSYFICGKSEEIKENEIELIDNIIINPEP